MKPVLSRTVPAKSVLSRTTSIVLAAAVPFFSSFSPASLCARPISSLNAPDTLRNGRPALFRVQPIAENKPKVGEHMFVYQMQIDSLSDAQRMTKRLNLLDERMGKTEKALEGITTTLKEIKMQVGLASSRADTAAPDQTAEDVIKKLAAHPELLRLLRKATNAPKKIDADTVHYETADDVIKKLKAHPELLRLLRKATEEAKK